MLTPHGLGAKDVTLAPITRAESNDCVRAWHYSGRPYSKSILHVGAFLNGKLCGVLAWGPGVDTRKLIGLVPGTPWDGYLELNRMALSPECPRNSESRAISVCVSMMRRHAPWLRWLVSFADGGQSGDGVIYRAAGWTLTQQRENSTLYTDTETGAVVSAVGIRTSARLRLRYGRSAMLSPLLTPIDGSMRRYMIGLTRDAQASIASMAIAGTREAGPTAPPSRAFDSTCPLYIPTQTGDRPTLAQAISGLPRYTDPGGMTGSAGAQARRASRADRELVA